MSIPATKTPDSFYATWQAGVMRRTGNVSAVGVAGYIGAGDEARGGIRGRARLWLSPRVTLDVAPGLVLFDKRYGADLPGFSGEVALGYREMAALSLQVESVRNPFSEHDVIWYPGIKAQGLAGLAMGAAGGGGDGDRGHRKVD